MKHVLLHTMLLLPPGCNTSSPGVLAPATTKSMTDMQSGPWTAGNLHKANVMHDQSLLTQAVPNPILTQLCLDVNNMMC
jgi:hypothetical protein